MKVPPDFGIDDAQLTSVTVPNDLRSVKKPERAIMDLLERHGFHKETIFAIKLAFEEAITNAVKHGNRNDPTRHVYLRYYVDDRRAVIMVRDEGPGFCPDHVPDPTADENLERPCGRGIMLMATYMTKLRFNDRGNEVWMLKENTPPEEAPA
ncbi:MAG: ATP-binding protein [Phycisphaerales bacterium]|nr:ATP-binding protein [Phycisphaerales bacterium]